MNEKEFDRLISESLKEQENIFPEIPEEPEQRHVFSEQFVSRMNSILPASKPRRAVQFWKWWFVLAAVLLTLMACSLTAYGSKTNQIHFFADRFEEYQPLETMAEDAPATAELTYDLDFLVDKYDAGVEIVNGEQYTRFFTDPETGNFFEFSSYPKIFFRYHLEQQETEQIILDDKELLYFTDLNQIHYALWSASSTVFVVRSDMSREQFLDDLKHIQIYEIT